MVLFGSKDKPKEAKDWAKVIALTFGIGVLGLIFANQYVAEFPLTTQTFIFIIIAAVALFIGLRVLRFATPDKQLALEDFIIYGALLVGLVFAVKYFDIAPTFSVIANKIASATKLDVLASMVGLG